MIFGANIPFAEHCAIEALSFEGGRTRLRVDLAPFHANNLGMAHGGLVATLLDLAMGTAARCTSGGPVVTLDMQVSFLSPGRGVLVAEGWIVRAGRSVLFCEAEIRGPEGELVARSTGLMKPTRARERIQTEARED